LNGFSGSQYQVPPKGFEYVKVVPSSVVIVLPSPPVTTTLEEGEPDEVEVGLLGEAELLSDDDDDLGLITTKYMGTTIAMSTITAARIEAAIISPRFDFTRGTAYADRFSAR
jgi:hypothetical protein